MTQAIPSEYLSLDRKDRTHKPFYHLSLRKPEDRVLDFEDVVIPFTEKKAKIEAARCIHCPDPAPCMVACPTHNDIPSAMWLIEHGEFVGAARLYRQSSALPEICSRVCPHEQLCEGSCVLNKEGEPVLTGILEAFAVDYARHTEGVVIPIGESTGHKVAIIGAGPAGLGCAERLRRIGHDVTIFEAKPASGGLLTYGIPNFKISKEIVFDRIGDLEKAGVEFVFETFIGKDKTIDELFTDGYGAVFIGIGSQIDAPLKADGADLPGVYLATEFLIRTNVKESLLPDDMKKPLHVGKKVVVVGGGDTASDALRSALRLGADEVTCIYRRTENEMPGSAKDRKMAKEEGAIYKFLTQPIKFHADENGNLGKVECLEMELGEPDDSGRRRPIKIEDSNFFIEADTVVLALGYWPDPIIGDTTPDLETYDWGLVTINSDTGATSRPGVFAGGDAATGPDLVVTAMVGGQKAAIAIDRYLNKL